MADEFKDDEYHFSDSGESEAFDEEAISSTVASTSTINHVKKGVLGLIGAFVFVLFAYQFIMPHFKKSSTLVKKESKAPTKIVTQKKRTPVMANEPKPVVASTPMVTTSSTPTPTPTQTPAAMAQNNYSSYPTAEPTSSPQVITKDVVSPRIQSKINALTRSNRKAKEEIGELNSKLSSMDSHFTDAADKLSTLNRNIQLLTQQMAIQQAELKVLKAAQVKKDKAERMALAEKKAVYYVQAIIPGRAWLMSERGATVTVAEGVNLKDYGRILSIDAKAGEVTTSSGKTIKFNPDDL